MSHEGIWPGGGAFAVRTAAEAVLGIFALIVTWLFRTVILKFLFGSTRIIKAFIGNYNRLASIKLIAFNRDREDYSSGMYRGTRPGSISSYVATARKEVVVVSVSLFTGIQYDHLVDVLRALVEDFQVRVTVSLICPTANELVHSMASTQGLGTEELRGQIISATAALLDFRKSLSPKARRLVSLRHHKSLPFASAIMIDPSEKRGTIQLETKPYGLPMTESFGFTLRAGGKHPLYGRLFASYSKLVSDGEAAKVPRRRASPG